MHAPSQPYTLEGKPAHARPRVPTATHAPSHGRPRVNTNHTGSFARQTPQAPWTWPVKQCKCTHRYASSTFLSKIWSGNSLMRLLYNQLQRRMITRTTRPSTRARTCVHRVSNQPSQSSAHVQRRGVAPVHAPSQPRALVGKPTHARPRVPTVTHAPSHGRPRVNTACPHRLILTANATSTADVAR